MRNPSDIKFSLILPTRGRMDRLVHMLESYRRLATDPQSFEVILLCDYDDVSARNFEQYIRPDQRGRVIFGHRADHMIRDYNNFGAQCATGRYLWQLNDDYEMVTQNWDQILTDRIETFLANKRDRVAYVQVDDSTHTLNGRAEEWGCCCPILTVEAVDIMNANMPAEIQMWGADIWLWVIFKQLEQQQSCPRIIRMLDDIKVLHHSQHNKTAPQDDQARRVEALSHKRGLEQHEVDVYVNKLISSIRLRN